MGWDDIKHGGMDLVMGVMGSGVRQWDWKMGWDKIEDGGTHVIIGVGYLQLGHESGNWVG